MVWVVSRIRFKAETSLTRSHTSINSWLNPRQRSPRWREPHHERQPALQLIENPSILIADYAEKKKFTQVYLVISDIPGKENHFKLFAWNFILESLINFWRQVWILIKLGQKQRLLRTKAGYILISRAVTGNFWKKRDFFSQQEFWRKIEHTHCF